MRLVLNEETCSQHGQCVGAAPELLGFGDDGKLKILVDICPTQSLRLAKD